MQSPAHIGNLVRITRVSWDEFHSDASTRLGASILIAESVYFTHKKMQLDTFLTPR